MRRACLTQIQGELDGALWLSQFPAAWGTPEQVRANRRALVLCWAGVVALSAAVGGIAWTAMGVLS